MTIDLSSERNKTMPVIRATSALAPLLVLACLTANSASAQSINLDFGPAAPFGTAASFHGGPGFLTAPWNQVSGNAVPFVGALGGPILDSHFQPTVVEIQLTAGIASVCSASCVGAGPTGSDVESLLDDYSRFTNGSDLLIRGLLPGIYNVYVSAWAPDDPTAITMVDGAPVGGAWSGSQQFGTTYVVQNMVPVGGDVPLRIRLRGAMGTLNAVQLLHQGLQVGSNYCQAAVNSTGDAAAMTSLGSPSAGANNLFLGASGMPAHSFCLLLAGRDQDFLPGAGGSAGNLCLGGAIGRLVGGQVFGTGSTGRRIGRADLANHPTPTGFVSVAAGQTWNFQGWFRDTVGGVATSNYTEGLSIPFV